MEKGEMGVIPAKQAASKAKSIEDEKKRDRELRDLERKWVQAMMSGDHETASTIAGTYSAVKNKK